MKKILLIIILFLMLTTNSFGRIISLYDWANLEVTILNRNITYLTFVTPKREGNYFLCLQQDKEGNRKVMFPADIKWIGNEIPTLTKRPNAIDIICFLYIYGIYYGMVSSDIGCKGE